MVATSADPCACCEVTVCGSSHPSLQWQYMRGLSRSAQTPLVLCAGGPLPGCASTSARPAGCGKPCKARTQGFQAGRLGVEGEIPMIRCATVLCVMCPVHAEHCSCPNLKTRSLE